ncbi:lanthionine synthetase C family protein [Nocardiopsis metallicus]|uniref:Lanthionine synthetase n=1 Tax=Nocardiopsis metallicus TaxID=179819 RepID=A0A840WFF3_9ACTN|nr:lanthionine synthetase C family protein [Nocardiopsis metallicus]MBB5494834.1 hypothetical protein [Nocardiopsis metallicus]
MKTRTTAQAGPVRAALDTALAALDTPAPVPPGQPWAATSLASGTIGSALAHIENARTTTAPTARDQAWVQAHRWVQAATAHGVEATDASALYLGVPAVTFALDAAGRYRATQERLLEQTVAVAHRRVDAASARLRSEVAATFAEYDVFFGLTGLGALLLRTAPGDDALGRILQYLVSLTRPRTVQGCSVPGWWVSHDPRRGVSRHFPAGHANLGMAHGMGGILALLATAHRAGATVPGHDEALHVLLEYLDAWAQDGPAGPWWPETLTLHDVVAGSPHHGGPARPSWCYGTPGLARAGQLAALALGDRPRQEFFEHALDRCLSDPAQLARINDAGLCHGWAGLYQTTWRASTDAITPALAAHLPHLRAVLAASAAPGTGDAGFLDGTAGTALALMTALTDTAPATGWDTCLLIA